MVIAAESEAVLLERLANALEHAEDTFRCGARADHEDALLAALDVIGTLYGELGEQRSPEVVTHLDATYDACVRGLGDAFGGRLENLVAATARVRSILSLLAPPTAGKWLLLAA